MGVVLGIYLFRTGLKSSAIGLVIAAGLAGAASATVLLTIAANQIRRRPFLVILSLLSAIGGIALAMSPSLPILATMAFVAGRRRITGSVGCRSAAAHWAL